MPASRSRASSSRKAIGSSETLPEVMTSGHARVGEQQVVERGVGQHHAEVARSAGPPRARRRRPVAFARSRSAAAARSAASRRRGELDQLARRTGVGRHQRERLVLAMLASAQRATASSSSARQARWKPPSPLTARIRPSRSSAAAASIGSRRGGSVLVARGVDQPRARAAHRTRVRLGVEAAIARVLVLAPALRAHLERGHGRQGSVVGHTGHDREPGSAVGAVREGVPVAPVGGIEELGQAGVAGGGVRRDRDVRVAGALRGHDRELALAGCGGVLRHQVLHGGHRRSVSCQSGQELLDPLRCALDLDQHSVLVVEHVTAELESRRQPEDVRPEPDPLNRSRDPGPDPPRAARHGSLAHPVAGSVASTSSRSTWYPLACASWMRGMCCDRVTTTWSASASAATRPPS